MEGIISEARELKECIKTGYYERAYELAQNIEDELISIVLREGREDGNL